MATRTDLVPPGIHLAADLSWERNGRLHSAQLRILGDDNRGYLLMGAFELAAADELEFWFATVAEAKDVAASLGVPRESWMDVTTASQVKRLPRQAPPPA